MTGPDSAAGYSPGAAGYSPGERPAPFSRYTTPEFWNDPHISEQMLRHHLDPQSDRASRRHDFIGRSAAWIHATLQLESGNSVLDLGCGPGLYAIPGAGSRARSGSVIGT